MKKQKFLIVDNPKDVNDWLDLGWEVISVTAQIVSAGSYSEKGKFAVVIEDKK